MASTSGWRWRSSLEVDSLVAPAGRA
jgi:hypothetical protein